jgi:hypothetical protein
MIPLVYTDAAIKAFRAAVEASPIDLAEMRRIEAGRAPIVGDRPGYDLLLDVGWRIVYSIEEHPRKDGQGGVWLRHMSMSQAEPGRWPHPTALEVIAGLLGFPPLAKCLVREDPGTGAIAVIAELEPTP